MKNKIKLFLHQKFGIIDFLDLFPYGVRMWYYDNVLPIIKPKHTRIRKIIPKTWKDLSALIVDVNFEIIKSFYEDEYINGEVDWSANEPHKKFADWLEKAYKYVNEVRPSLLEQRDNSYPASKPFNELFKPIVDENGRRFFEMVDDGIPYEKKYAEVIRLENLIDDNDTETLTNMIKFREYFWT